MQTLLKPTDDPRVWSTYQSLQQSHGDEVAQSYLAFQQRAAIGLPAVPDQKLPKNRVQRSKPAPVRLNQKRTAFDYLIQDAILAVLEPGAEPLSAYELMNVMISEPELVQQLLERHAASLRRGNSKVRALEDSNDDRVRRVCKTLVTAGVMGARHDGKRFVYWLLATEERHFQVRDRVVECLGTPSERYGQIIDFRPHPHRPEQRFPFIRWQNGSVPSFSSVDLLYPWRLNDATDPI